MLCDVDDSSFTTVLLASNLGDRDATKRDPHLRGRWRIVCLRLASGLIIVSETEPVIYDVFVSHASEDKSYVEPLVEALKNAGITVWYDRLVLVWGDDLRSRIDHGLANCRFGIVILSEAFLKKKKWTEFELNGMFAREQAGRTLVLPVWHGITRDDLLVYSPTLADRLAKISASAHMMKSSLI